MSTEHGDFIVPGRPVGYTRQTTRSKWTPQAKRYHEYQEAVRAYATAAGLSVPLLATADDPVFIDVQLHLNAADWKSYASGAPFPDPENVRKGIVDALFYVSNRAKKLGKRLGIKTGNDRYCYGEILVTDEALFEKGRVWVNVLRRPRNA